MEEPLHVLLVAEDEFSNLAEHYRLKLDIDGYRVTTIAAERLTAQRVREVSPDFVLLEIRRRTRRMAAVWAKLRWACAGKRTPIIVLSADHKELNKLGIHLDSGDHVVDWSRASGLRYSAG